MALSDDLKAEVTQIFREQWTTQVTTGVPDPEDLGLGNFAKDLEDATVLYADIDGSTDMVDTENWWFCAEVYKAYLRCAARIITAEKGAVTAYDGDRIMAIFTGDKKNSRAVRAAFKISHAVNQLINPGIQSRYTDSIFVLKHKIGIDTSQLRAARIGVRGNNDLVWVGRAANYAAKLTALGGSNPIWITGDIYSNMDGAVTYRMGTQIDLWQRHIWNAMNDMEIYSTDGYWTTID